MSQVGSQTISKEENKVKTIISKNGDTLIQMSLLNAKIILQDLLEKEVNDKILAKYVVLDSLNNDKVILLSNKIDVLLIEKNNLKSTVNNLNEIILNKNDEVLLLNEIIRRQSNEIKKQKFLKTIALVGDVVLPIATFFLVLTIK